MGGSETEGRICVPANFNSQGQVVISGEVEGVQEAMTLAKEAGAKKAVPLTVSGAFHSPLMEPAGRDCGIGSRKSSSRILDYPVISNVTAEPVSDGSASQGAPGGSAHLPGSVEGFGGEDGGTGCGTFLRIGPRNRSSAG